MQGRTESEVPRRRPLVVGMLTVLALGVALALVSTSSGGTASPQGAAAKPVMVTGGKGYGEVYAAKAAILKKTLFNAKLLPKNKMARNIALAAYGRSDKKVNYALALKCWKNNGCTTGTGGKLTVAYVEGFGENVYRQVSKMEFILQALTYPQVGKIIYTSAHSDLNQALTDFRAAISQNVNLIVTYPDFGDAMLPVFKEATKAGIPVATYAWGYVSGPGKNYTTVVGEDTCKLGKAFANVMNTQVKSGDIAFMGGFPGNPLSLGWQKCEQAALNKSINVVANEPTNWDPSKVQGVVAGVLAQHPNVKGWSYEDARVHVRGRVRGLQGGGHPLQRRAHAPHRRDRDGLSLRQAQEPQPQGLLLHRRELADPGRLHGRDDEAPGREDPTPDRLPDPAAEPGQAQHVRQGLSAVGVRDVSRSAEPAPQDVPLGGKRARARKPSRQRMSTPGPRSTARLRRAVVGETWFPPPGPPRLDDVGSLAVSHTSPRSRAAGVGP